MTQVLVVCKTRMKTGLCLGGLTLDGMLKIRMLPADGWNQPTTTPLEVGQVWDCLLDPARGAKKPHTEDMRVLRQRLLRNMPDMRGWLLDNLRDFQRHRDDLFGGTLERKDRGSAFASERRGLPGYAHEFWLTEADLALRRDGRRDYYFAQGMSAGPLRIPFVFLESPPRRIPAGSLLHLSLTRPYAPNPSAEAVCWLQISAIYG